MRDIRRQVGIMLRWLPLLAVGAIVAGILGFTYASGQPKVYQASGKVLVDAGFGPDLNALETANGLALQYAGAVASADFAARVRDSTELANYPSAAFPTFKAEAIGNATISIVSRDADPMRAVAIVEAATRELFALSDRDSGRLAMKEADRTLAGLRREIRGIENRIALLQRQRDPPQGLIGLLRDRIAARRANIADWLPRSSVYERNRLVYLEHPREPSSPIEPRPTYWAILAAVAGLLAFTALAFIIESLRDKVEDVRTLEAASELPALGVVTERTGAFGRSSSRPILLKDPWAVEADAYRTIRVALDSVAGEASSMLVTGGLTAQALAVIATNLALAYAESGRRVLLVDASFRSPLLHMLAGVPNQVGITTLLAQPTLDLYPFSHTLASGLRLLTTGPVPPNPSEALVSASMRQLLTRLTAEADIVVVACGPLTEEPGSAALARITAKTLLVVTAGAPRSIVQSMARILLQSNVSVVGSVLFRRTRRRPRRSPRSTARARTGLAATPPARTMDSTTAGARAQVNGTSLKPASRDIVPIHPAGGIGPYWLPPTSNGASNRKEASGSPRRGIGLLSLGRLTGSGRHVVNGSATAVDVGSPEPPLPPTADPATGSLSPHDPDVRLRREIGPYALTPPTAPPASGRRER